jgi:hypothetical protein
MAYGMYVEEAQESSGIGDRLERSIQRIHTTCDQLQEAADRIHGPPPPSPVPAAGQLAQGRPVTSLSSTVNDLDSAINRLQNTANRIMGGL